MTTLNTAVTKYYFVAQMSYRRYAIGKMGGLGYSIAIMHLPSSMRTSDLTDKISCMLELYV